MPEWILFEGKARKGAMDNASPIDEYHQHRLSLAEKLLLDKAYKGELWAIQNLLLLVSEALADGVSLTPNVALYISDALRKIYSGEKADTAFGIVRKRGEKDNRRPRQRAFLMADLIERLRFHNKETLESAVAIASEKYHVSADTAKKAWKDNYKEIRRQINLEKNHLGKVMPIILP